MKIEFRIEHGKTLIVFPDEIERDKSVGVWSEREEHCSASRAYLRTLKKPETEAERNQAWQTIRFYCDRYRTAFQ